MDTADILAALELHYSVKNNPVSPEWAYFSEMAVDTGSPQRIDFYAINCWNSKRYLRIAYEIKVSRADFRAELRAPLKRDAALRLSNEFYFIAPRGLLKPVEMPEGCGLREVNDEGRIVTRLRAPQRDTPDPDAGFLAALARRACRAEKIKLVNFEVAQP